MKRRSFLKKMGVLATAPWMLNGIPLSALAGSREVQRLSQQAASDRVLVIIQLHGGNDGLNTLIPLDQYARYYHLRPNLAIADRGLRKHLLLDSSLADNQQIGLHPDTSGFKDLYERSRMAVVQSVGYENFNGSHFRSRDIWFMGGDSNQYFGSGWIGRYLDDEFPGFPQNHPNAEMPDPPGLELGNTVSLGFHRDSGIPMGIAVDNPEQFYRLITSVGIDPPASVENSYYGEELRWIMDIEQKSNQYAPRLREVYERGNNSSVVYPDLYPFNAPQNALRNGLPGQLRLIARMLAGGIKTKVFLARIGGFDTHAFQVESHDASMGIHSALLYHLSESVNAFQKDLRALGIEDRVLTVTMSEFGRRATSNGSFGSDHGKAAPMFVFGRQVNPGIYGINPNLSELDRGNVPMQYDYRQVFASVLQDWMCASPAAMAASRFGPFIDSRLPLIAESITSRESFISRRNYLRDCYPNPVKKETTMTFRISQQGPVTITLLDTQGREVMTLLDSEMTPGEHTIAADLSALQNGTYLYKLESPRFSTTKKLLVDHD